MMNDAEELARLRRYTLEVLIEAEGTISEYHNIAKPPVKARVGKELKQIRAAIRKIKP